MTSLVPGEQTAGFLLVILFLVVGFGLATIGWVDAAAASDVMANAEPTEVTVVESEVSERRSGSDNDRSYSVTIVYEYEVDGETYRSSNVRPGVSDRSYDRRSRASAVVGRYPEGETVTGYVDPDTPERAYLEHPSPADQFGNKVFNAVLTLVGVLVFLASAVGALRFAAMVER